MALKREENPFVFGEVVGEMAFVDRTEEVEQLVRDIADGQRVFLLSPWRFGKSSLVAMAFQRLKKQHIRTVTVPVSSLRNVHPVSGTICRQGAPGSRTLGQG